ncbi:hypothetical protein NN561_000042 [Cricetulus griseus]
MAEGAPASCTGRVVGRANRVQPLTYVCIAKRLLRVHRGAAAGVGRAQQRGQQQEAERQAKAAGRGAHGAQGACVRLLWRGLGGRARPSSPGPLPRANFLSSLSRGGSGEGRARGSAPSGEERGWGAASERSPARLLRCLLWLCLLRARAEPPFYCAPRILCSSSRWLAASAGRALPATLLPRRPALPRTPAFVVPSLARLWAPAPPGTLRRRATRAVYLTARWGRTHAARFPKRLPVWCVLPDGP